MGRRGDVAFGNALGASLGQQIRQGGQQEDRLGDFINEQEAAQTQRDMAAAKTSFRQSEIAYQNETESAPSSMGGGSGLRLGGGGIGIRLPSSAVKDWSDGIDGGIMLNGSMAPAEQRRALRTYTVQPGDNPASIGVKFFGDSRAGATILADNGLDASVRGARNLPVGTVLTLRDDISEGNLRAGGRLIGADTSIRAQERAAVAEAQARADQAREEALRMGTWSGRTNQVTTGVQTSGPAMVSQDVYTAAGDYAGSEMVPASGAGAGMPYAQSVGNALAATVEIGYGALKGVVNGVPEMAVGVLKGYAYIGAGLRDGIDSATGARSQNYLGRAIEAGSAYSGEVLSYEGNGLQRMGGYAGELLSPGAYAKAGELGVMGLRALGPTLDAAATNYMSRNGMMLYAVPDGAAASAVSAGRIEYGALDALGRPTGVRATITESMLGTGTAANPSIIPPGWSGNGTLFNEARGHLLGRQLGGSGDVAENLVTLQQNPVNSPFMRGFENQVRSAIEGGQTVGYSSTPIYNGANWVPKAITLSGRGSGDFNLNVTILNPLGR